MEEHAPIAPRAALAGLALLSTACASAPRPLTLAVEATLGCVVATIESRGFREEARWRGSGRSTIRVRFRRAGDELTVTLDDQGQGTVSIRYSYPRHRRAAMESQLSFLRTLVRNRCLP
jgi:hypothetical protein